MRVNQHIWRGFLESVIPVGLFFFLSSLSPSPHHHPVPRPHFEKISSCATVYLRHSNIALDMSSYQPIALPGGIYAPIPTPFTEQEELNLDSLVKHALRLARAGVGLVISGSTGEAVALTNAERSLTIKSIRDALQTNGLTKIPIIAGTGTGSLKETITLSQEAKEAGADAVIVIAPGYFSSAIAKDRKALKEFFWCVIGSSPQLFAVEITGAD